MKKNLASMVALAALAFTSCTTVTPGWGNVNNFSGLDDVLNNVRGDKYISNIGNESVSSEKIGKAGSVFVFGLIPVSHGGDITVAKAMKNGDIKKINTVETITTYYPFVFTRTTIVTGE